MIKHIRHILIGFAWIAVTSSALAQTDSKQNSTLMRIKATFKSCVPCTEDSLQNLATLYLDSVYEDEQLSIYIFQGQSLKRNGKFLEAEKIYKNILKSDSIFQIKNSQYYFDFLINYGIVNYNLEKYDTAIQIYKNTLYLLNENKELKDRIRYSEMVYSNLTNVYTSQLDYENAIDLLIHAMETDFSESFHINQNLARQYSELKMYDEAIKFYKKSLTLTEDINLIASSYLNLGAIYKKKEVKDSALYFMKKCLDTVKSVQTKIYCTYNLTDYYLEATDYPNAKKYIQFGEQLIAPLEVKKYQSLFDLSNGTLALKQKNYKEAIAYYQKINLSNVPWHDFHLEYYKNYSDAANAVNNSKKAYELLNKYTTLKDSIETYQNEVRFVSIINNYHLHQKQDEIKILNQKSELFEKDKEIKKQQTEILNETIQNQKSTIIWIILITTILVTSIVLLVRFRLKRKKTENELLKEKQKLKEVELKSLQQKMDSEKLIAGLVGEEKERSRLASELHDGIGSALTGLRLKFHSQKGNIGFEQELADIYNEVRLISHRLSPPLENDIRKLLTNLTERYFDYTPIKYTINWFPEERSFNIKGSDKINFYRLIQEVYNNVIKHSKSNLIEISVNIIEHSFNIIIEDYGIGFDLKDKNNTFGLENIHKRAKSLNASLDIDSKINRGTSISLTFKILDYD